MFSKLSDFHCRNHEPLVQLKSWPSPLFIQLYLYALFLCCVFHLIFPTMFFSKAQQDSTEQDHHYLAFIFVLQTLDILETVAVLANP